MDRKDVVTQECVVLVVVGEWHESLQKLRVAVDIAKVRGAIKVFLCVAD